MTNTIRSPRHVPRSPDGALLALPWEPQSRLPSSIIGIIIIVLRSYAPHSCTGLQLPRPSSLDHRVLHTWLEVIRQSRHTVRLQERSARRGRQCQTRRSSSQFISSLPFLPSPPLPLHLSSFLFDRLSHCSHLPPFLDVDSLFQVASTVNGLFPRTLACPQRPTFPVRLSSALDALCQCLVSTVTSPIPCVLWFSQRLHRVLGHRGRVPFHGLTFIHSSL